MLLQTSLLRRTSRPAHRPPNDDGIFALIGLLALLLLSLLTRLTCGM